MDPLAKVPVQVHLFPEQVEELQAIADRWHVSVEDVIRQSVGTLLTTLYMRDHPAPPESEEDDPLLGIIGLFDSGVGDLAENHDQYIAELVYAESHPCPEKSS